MYTCIHTHILMYVGIHCIHMYKYMHTRVHIYEISQQSSVLIYFAEKTHHFQIKILSTGNCSAGT